MRKEEVAAAAAAIGVNLKELPDKDRKKYEAIFREWANYIDFMLRQVAKVSYRLNIFMTTKLPVFAAAMATAESVREEMAENNPDIVPTITSWKVFNKFFAKYLNLNGFYHLTEYTVPQVGRFVF